MAVSKSSFNYLEFIYEGYILSWLSLRLNSRQKKIFRSILCKRYHNYQGLWPHPHYCQLWGREVCTITNMAKSQSGLPDAFFPTVIVWCILFMAVSKSSFNYLEFIYEGYILSWLSLRLNSRQKKIFRSILCKRYHNYQGLWPHPHYCQLWGREVCTITNMAKSQSGLPDAWW